MASKLCDSCKSATATLFCRADSAFLCVTCDSKVHAANKLTSRHARVWVCEVCEQAPAHVTCKADAAALCFTCDQDIHSANPLAQRHDRVPVTPFYDSTGSKAAVNYLDDQYLPEIEGNEEEEAASWLVGDPGNNPFVYAPSFTQSLSVSSLSIEVGVVPDGSATTDISNPYSGSGLDAVNQTVALSPVDREARVLRYREKRKNRKFQKFIRYASRKAYAETRPRIKGRFAKRTDIDVDVERNSVYAFGIVPSF